ncbi:MAG: hypothetical protein M1833_003917 [Piccolia ochrophora]|nr:MAG: hypothetical protein M1833_003917 [Piccolia ochrophora]
MLTTAVTNITRGLAQSTQPLKATWTRIPAGDIPPRSAHALVVVDGRAHIFGGEGTPNDPAGPIDNSMIICTLPPSSSLSADIRTVPARSSTSKPEDMPAPRAGHTAAVIGKNIYIFGGRAPHTHEPLDEKGRVWVFDTRFLQWTPLDPCPDTPIPPARSHHACTANEHPVPTATDHTTSPVLPDGHTAALDATHHGTLFIHAGRTGAPDAPYLNDLWTFDVAARTWSLFPTPPSPARSSPALVYAQHRLYRFGGFDGTASLGAQLDVLHVVVSTFDDKGGKGELAITPRDGDAGAWRVVPVASGADGAVVPFPSPRSAAGFVPVSTGQGRRYALLLLGERQEDGVFRDDVWSLQLPPEGMTGASFKDAGRMMVGKDTGEESWSEAVVVKGDEEEEGVVGRRPSARGGFACGAVDVSASEVVLWGGVEADGTVVGDGWLVRVR